MNNVKTPDARLLALDVVSKVWDEGAYANLALSSELAKHDMPPIERHFATELSYGAVKAGNVLDMILQKFITRPFKKIPPRILNILRLGVYQIYFLDRIPDSAACNEAVKLSRKYAHEGTVKFVNAVLRNAVRFKADPGINSDKKLEQAIKLQHPSWLIKLWQKQIGSESTQELCMFNNKNAPVCLRTNLLKTTPEELSDILHEEGVSVERSKWAKEGLVLKSAISIAASESFKRGLFQVQDESSMLVAHYLDAQEGQFVIDVCAAPGGKTTHIAESMSNKGAVLAADIYEHKLDLINYNAKRLGIDIIKTVSYDAAFRNAEWIGKADRVLADVPCSGLGVLRRRPDLRWRRMEKDTKIFPDLQLAILKNAAIYLKKGGRLVYSTCTTMREENQGVIENFLIENKDFAIKPLSHPRTGEIKDCLQLWPQIDGTDGFFICVLEYKL